MCHLSIHFSPHESRAKVIACSISEADGNWTYWLTWTDLHKELSLVTTVTYNPSQHGCGCYADVPLMFLQHCFQISTPECWFRTKLFSWNLNLHRTICIYTSVSRPCQWLCTASKREWDVCWRSQTLNFNFSFFVSNVPLNFLTGWRCKDRGKKEKHIHQSVCVWGVGGVAGCGEVRRVVVGV